MTILNSINFTRPVQSFTGNNPSPSDEEESPSAPSAAPKVFSSSDGLTGSPEWISRLSDFLNEIIETPKDAQENGYPIPNVSTLMNALKFGRNLFNLFPSRYEAYAGTNGEVVIDADGNRDSVLILCEKDGTAVIMSYLDGVQESTKYDTIDALPNDFLLDKIKSVD